MFCVSLLQQKYEENFHTLEKLHTKTFLCLKNDISDEMAVPETATDRNILDVCIRYIKKYMPFIEPDTRWESPLEEIEISDAHFDDLSKLNFRNLRDPRTGKLLMRVYCVK